MKTERFELKLSVEDKSLIVKASHIQNQSIASFVLEAAVKRANRILSNLHNHRE